MLSLKQRAKALPLKRAYGQNFLVDAAVLDAIVAAALPPTSSSPHLIEIGCGAGFLTERLLAIGAEKAAAVADGVLGRAREAIGLLPR